MTWVTFLSILGTRTRDTGKQGGVVSCVWCAMLISTLITTVSRSLVENCVPGAMQGSSGSMRLSGLNGRVPTTITSVQDECDMKTTNCRLCDQTYNECCIVANEVCWHCVVKWACAGYFGILEPTPEAFTERLLEFKRRVPEMAKDLGN